MLCTGGVRLLSQRSIGRPDWMLIPACGPNTPQPKQISISPVALEGAGRSKHTTDCVIDAGRVMRGGCKLWAPRLESVLVSSF